LNINVVEYLAQLQLLIALPHGLMVLLVLVLLEGHHVAPASTAVILNLGRLWCSFQLGGGAQVGGAQIWL